MQIAANTGNESHTAKFQSAITGWPWGIEQTSDMLWVGPLRPDGMKVEQVVVSLNFDTELTTAAKIRQIANAHLIAAAPDLLEILKEISSEAIWASYPDAYWKVKQASMERVRTAIARATGEAA